MYTDYARFELDEAGLVAALRELRRDNGLSVELEQARYHAPLTLDEFAALYLAHPDASILAGGTDVGLWVTKQLRELPAVIYLGNVAELGRVAVGADGIEVGAAVTLSDAFEAIEPHYSEFGEMFRRFASLPVRNAGTLVGNVANGSPIGDSMPALMAVSARVRLRRGEQRREMALEDLYLDYMKNAMQQGEFIESIVIPPREEALLLRCYKLSKRFDQDISAVCAAFALRLDGERISEIRIALGGMAAIPKRALQTEQFLSGRNWDEATIRMAMDSLCKEFTPMSDMRASAAYRSRATANLLYRFYLETRPGQALESAAVNVFAVTA
jgi:xanthine dehydrogenase small subunit